MRIILVCSKSSHQETSCPESLLQQPFVFLACRVKLLDMADHADGLDLSKEQAVIAVCSTQVYI